MEELPKIAGESRILDIVKGNVSVIECNRQRKMNEGKAMRCRNDAEW